MAPRFFFSYRGLSFSSFPLRPFSAVLYVVAPGSWFLDVMPCRLDAFRFFLFYGDGRLDVYGFFSCCLFPAPFRKAYLGGLHDFKGPHVIPDD